MILSMESMFWKQNWHSLDKRNMQLQTSRTKFENSAACKIFKYFRLVLFFPCFNNHLEQVWKDPT